MRIMVVWFMFEWMMGYDFIVRVLRVGVSVYMMFNVVLLVVVWRCGLLMVRFFVRR